MLPHVWCELNPFNVGFSFFILGATRTIIIHDFVNNFYIEVTEFSHYQQLKIWYILPPSYRDWNAFKNLIGIIKAHQWPWVTWLSLKCPLSSIYLSLVMGALQGRIWGGSCQELLRPKYLEAVWIVPSSSVRKEIRKVGYKRNQKVNLLVFSPDANELSAWVTQR